MVDLDSWESGRRVLDELLDRWRQEIVRTETGVLYCSIDIEPAEPPPSGSSWSWLFCFNVNGVHIEAMAARDIEDLIFADESGYFEVPVPIPDVPVHVLEQARGHF